MRIFLFLVIIHSFVLRGQSFSYPQSSDSLKALISQTTEDTTKIRALNYLGVNYRDTKEESLPHYKKALSLAKAINDSNLIAFTCGNIATVYYYSTQYDSAMVFMERVAAIRKSEGKHNAYVSALNNIGILSRKSHNLPRALECFQERLSFEKERNDSTGIAETYNNLANLYDQFGDREKAIRLNRLSLNIRAALKDSAGLASSYNNIATTFDNMNLLDSAIYYYKKSLKIADKVPSSSFIGNINNNIGQAYSSAGNDSLGEHYLLIALEERKRKNYYFGIGQSNNNLSKIYERWGEIEKAKNCALEAYKIGVKYEHILIKKDASARLASVYNKLGDYKNAYKFSVNATRLRDSLSKTEQVREYAQREFAYQYEQKRLADSIETEKFKEIKRKEDQLERLKNEQRAKRDEMIIWIVVAVGLILAVLAIVLYRGYKSKSKSNDLIQAKNLEIQEQSDTLKERNKEITDSIAYAKRIQTAILPPQELIEATFPQSFVIYKPKDIVAGDFYWLEQQGDTRFIAAADCTGHGVPGAMVSVICNNGLNRSVNEFERSDPGKILDQTRQLVINEFEKSSDNVKDGMDIALCSLQSQADGTTRLRFAGANNPLWIYRSNQDAQINPVSQAIEEIKGDKQPVGVYESSTPFTTHELVLNKGDIIYLFSDGFADQFGGPKGKKFKNASFKKLIASICTHHMTEQKEALSNAFDEWQGGYEQLDDVCVIGVKI